MTLAWVQHQEALVSDCIISPDVFVSMVDLLCDFVVPYQPALETEAAKRHCYHYYLTPTCVANRELARVIKAGTAIEASFQRDKDEAGLDAYQVRTWEG